MADSEGKTKMKNKKSGLKLLNFKLFILLLNISFFGIFFLLPKGPLLAQIDVQNLIALTNQKRLTNYLPPLEVNDKLGQAAENKCRDMIAKNYFNHTDPNGKRFWEWIKEADYNYIYAGENLAMDFSDDKDVIAAWLASPTHRANILSPKFTQIGIAIKEGLINGDSTILIAQEFGTLVEKNNVFASEKISENSMIQPATADTFILPSMASYQAVDLFIKPINQSAVNSAELDQKKSTDETNYLNLKVVLNVNQNSPLIIDKNYQETLLAASSYYYKNKKDVLGENSFETSLVFNTPSYPAKNFLNQFFYLLMILIGLIIINLLSLATTIHLKNKSSKIPATTL